MKLYPPRIVRPPRHVRVAAFLPVPLRARHDGWTPARQAAFLVALARTGSVAAAARKVGMTRESAYRLRHKPGSESFLAAWDAALGLEQPRRKFTPQDRVRLALEGAIKPVVWRGECVGAIRKADNSAFLGLFKRRTRVIRSDAK